MSLFNSIFGEISRGNFGDLAYMRDGHLASFNFGQTNNYLELNHPRVKFMYFVRINFNPELVQFTSQYFKAQDISLLIPLVKSVDMPSVKIETTKLNQYNKKRISQTKLTLDPVKMSFYDVADGKVLRFWEMYYEYYFRDGVNADKVDPTTLSYAQMKFADDVVKGEFNSSQSGYNLASVSNSKYLLHSIDIYQVHGGSFCKTILVNPRISDYSPSSLSFSDSSLCETNITVEYEDVLYYNYATPMVGDDMEVFANSNFRDMKPTKPRIPLNINNRSGTALMIKRDGTVEDDSFLGKIAGAFGTSGKLLVSDILNVGSNLQRDVGSLLTSLPGVVASGVKTGILTGEFNFPINIKSATNNILEQARRGTVGAGVRSFGAAVEGTLGAATSTASNIFIDNDRGKPVSLEEIQAQKAQNGGQ